jgi:hypothetical protein
MKEASRICKEEKRLFVCEGLDSCCMFWEMMMIRSTGRGSCFLFTADEQLEDWCRPSYDCRSDLKELQHQRFLLQSIVDDNFGLDQIGNRLWGRRKLKSSDAKFRMAKKLTRTDGLSPIQAQPVTYTTKRIILIDPQSTFRVTVAKLQTTNFKFKSNWHSTQPSTTQKNSLPSIRSMIRSELQTSIANSTQTHHHPFWNVHNSSQSICPPKICSVSGRICMATHDSQTGTNYAGFFFKTTASSGPPIRGRLHT